MGADSSFKMPWGFLHLHQLHGHLPALGRRQRPQQRVAHAAVASAASGDEELQGGRPGDGHSAGRQGCGNGLGCPEMARVGIGWTIGWTKNQGGCFPKKMGTLTTKDDETW